MPTTIRFCLISFRKKFPILIALTALSAASGIAATAPEAVPGRWDPARATRWYEDIRWPVGANYLPSTAVNPLEMWQAETFDPKVIDQELGWAQKLGMTTMRVFLHDLPWKQDPVGFRARIDTFLRISQSHGIRPVLVFFDSCWNPKPKLGAQPAPRPGVHNSQWVQSPGLEALQDAKEYPRLEAYIEGVVGAFAKDSRILAWDVWNEPDNLNGSSYHDPDSKLVAVAALLPKAFAWARAANPEQPLTSGVWNGDWSSAATLKPIERIQLESSDVISFHSYDPPKEFALHMHQLEVYQRPVLCTEYMARPRGSTFEGIMPIAKKDKVALMNWGFVQGRSQTFYPWDSWESPYSKPPKVWFHDILRTDGTPYEAKETAFIQKMTAAK